MSTGLIPIQRFQFGKVDRHSRSDRSNRDGEIESLKLLFCPNCRDVKALQRNERVCRCGESRGSYVDDRKVIVSAGTLVLGIASSDLEMIFKTEGAGRPLRCWNIVEGSWDFKDVEWREKLVDF